MRRSLVALAALAWVCAAPATAKDQLYQGTDAGCLVYSVGTIKIGMKFTFPYGRVATAGGAAVDDWTGKIEPKVGGAIYLKVKNPDFTGDEAGHVVVRCLPPGRYQVGSYSFGGFLPGVASFKWSPDKPFVLPFEIKTGEATYIGSFMRAPSLGTTLEPSLGASGFFVVADRSARDLPIAAARLPSGMKIAAQVTDVSVFGNAALRTSQP